MHARVETWDSTLERRIVAEWILVAFDDFSVPVYVERNIGEMENTSLM